MIISLGSSLFHFVRNSIQNDPLQIDQHCHNNPYVISLNCHHSKLGCSVQTTFNSMFISSIHHTTQLIHLPCTSIAAIIFCLDVNLSVSSRWWAITLHCRDHCHSYSKWLNAFADLHHIWASQWLIEPHYCWGSVVLYSLFPSFSFKELKCTSVPYYPYVTFYKWVQYYHSPQALNTFLSFQNCWQHFCISFDRFSAS